MEKQTWELLVLSAEFLTTLKPPGNLYLNEFIAELRQRADELRAPETVEQEVARLNGWIPGPNDG
jgi:hypothetical protein